MAGKSSARPADLKTFVTKAGEASADLRTWITKLTASYQSFQASGSEGRVTSGTVETTLPNLVTRQQDTITFVDLVRVAFEQADSGSLGNGVLQVSDTELQATYEAIARANGLDPAKLDAVPAALTVPPVTTGAIPQTSGFVADPVCTATGHFLEDEVDLALPARLGVLAWPRRYSSRLLDAGPFGRGWWTWASARLAVDARGDAAYRGPDGRGLVFAAGGAERGWVPVAGLGARVAAAEDGGMDLAWDAGTTFDLQRWHFDEAGRLATVTGPTLGTTTFEHDGDRLVRLVHEGGRALDLRWEGERIVEAACSDGRRVGYAYDDAGDLVAVERADGGRRYAPDEHGRIVAVHDADGVRLCHNTYDDDGRVLRQVSPLGRETVFEYLPGRATRVSDTAGGPVALYEHDLNGRLIGLVNAEGRRFERTFDDHDRVVRQRHLDGTVVEQVPTAEPGTVELAADDGTWERWRYDDAGRLVAHDSSDDRSVTYAYEGDSSLPSHITSGGGTTVIEWRDGRPVRITDPDGVRVEVDYDADGCAVRAVDALGHETRFEPHVSGSPAVVRHADGTEHRFEWDDAGRLLAVRDPAGGEGRLEWSPAGRLLATVDPEGGRTSYTYASSGVLESVTDPLGRRGELRFDALANLVGITAANGAKWEYDWSTFGQLSLVHAPDGSTLSIRHDAEGRPTELTGPRGEVIAVADIRARAEAALAADDRAVTRTPGGRVATVTDRSGRTTTYTYDAAGRLATATTPSGAVWRVEHDERGRLAAVTSPEERRTAYGYDPTGCVASVEVAGARRRYRYDRCGRIVASTDPLGATVRYRYDAAGQLVAVTDPRGVVTEHRYDELGFVVETVDPLGSTVTTERDLLGRPIAQHDPLGRVTAWEHDLAGAPVAVTLATGERIPAVEPADRVGGASWTRDDAGRLLARRGPGGRTEARTYDADGHLQRVDDSRFGTIELTHDRDGLLTGLRAPGLTRTWAYDEAGQIVGYEEETAAGRRHTRLRRDLAGRVVEVREGDDVTTFAYDEAGQLVALHDRSGERAFAYDEAGRLVAESGPTGTRRLTYDAAGQLVRIDHDGGTTSLAYDAAGRRVAESGGGRDRTYRWGACNDLREVVHDGRATRIEVRPPATLAAVDGTALVWDTSSTPSRPLALGADHILTVAGLTLATASGDDPNGPVTWLSADWRGSVAPRDAWGRPDGGALAPALALGFGGEVEVAGLVWLRHRLLDPSTGQFLSPDPLGGVAGTAVATFPYHYAGNDPINRIDPLGLRPLSIDEYNKIRDRATGVQWDNVVTAAIVVAGAAATVLCPASAALWVGLAFGAASGAAPHLTNAVVYGDPIDWGTLGKDVVIGAAFGALGGGAAGWAGKTTAKVAAGEAVPALAAGTSKFMGTWAGEVGQGAANGFAVSTANELYDTTKLPGSNRDPFNWDTVVNNTAAGGAGGLLGKGIKTSRSGPRGAEEGEGGPLPFDEAPGPLGIEAPPVRPAIEAPPPRLAIEGPPPRLAIEAPPPRPAIEAAPPRPPVPEPVFSSAPEVHTPTPGGPHGSTDIQFRPPAQGNPNVTFSSPPEVHTPTPGGPHGSTEIVFQGPPG